jgi:hypothetical protein
VRVTNSLCNHTPWTYRIVSTPQPAGHLETLEGINFHLEVSTATCFCCARPSCQEAAKTWVRAMSGREAEAVPL